ncbi:hypothetical protein PHAVU_008G152700 [Phaseolus vulgaris]|uniref:Uncharacterized protein n=1 Tax=Phaseolus vulgaris TaxID=3885 RepID=V7B530_PHAVU|nr:hypothetical protein PHAVU_008G152700g [Phaseolus vulgaris]ESW12919.1 hypothetical protein PHAVU_008G152700g [Phaseolus vulgaris]
MEGRLEKMMKEKEDLKAKNAALEIAKVSIEVELEQLQDNVLTMCRESFNQAVRQAHMLYQGLPADGDFDVNKDVLEGCLLAFDELVALRNPMPRVDVQDIEDEDD